MVKYIMIKRGSAQEEPSRSNFWIWLCASIPLLLILSLAIPPFEQMRSLKWVENTGGAFETEANSTTARLPPKVKKWVLNKGVLQNFEAVQIVGLADRDLKDSDLGRLKGIMKLRGLYLDRTKVGDDGLSKLTDHVHLETLSLHQTQITNAGLAHLKDLSALHTLDLRGTQVGNAGLVHLKGMRALQTLNLNGTQVTDAGLVHLRKLPALSELYLRGTPVTKVAAEELKATSPALRRIYL